MVGGTDFQRIDLDARENFCDTPRPDRSFRGIVLATFPVPRRPTMSRNFLWFAAIAAVLGAPLLGCTSIDLRGDSFREDELSATVRRARPLQAPNEAWGVSNKALQIEKDFGYE